MNIIQTVSFSAHFDGRQIVPDEPFALEPDAELLVIVLPKRVLSVREEKNSIFDSKEDRELARAEIRASISAALESLRRGEGTDGDEFFPQMEAEEDSEREEWTQFSMRQLERAYAPDEPKHSLADIKTANPQWRE